MIISDKERVISFKRALENSDIYNKLIDLSEEDLLVILNSSVLPNAISNDNLKFSILFSMLFSKNKTELKKIEQSFKDISELVGILSRTEKGLLKYGYFYGFKYYNWEYAMNLFVKNSYDPAKGPLLKQKIISSSIFRKIFPFIYNIIKKGEKNERFPRF